MTVKRTITAFALIFFSLAGIANGLKISVIPGDEECLSESVDNVQGDPRSGPPRLDARISVSGSSHYYVPFVDVKVRSSSWLKRNGASISEIAI